MSAGIVIVTLERCQRSVTNKISSLAVFFTISLASPTTQFQARNIISATHAKNKPKLAASSYLNSAPLIWSFKHGSRKNQVELIEAVPARCADLLAEGRVDVALIPAIEYQRIPDLRLVSNVCVGSRKEVGSVILVSRLHDLRRIRRVALDESSRTSAVLVKIIFLEFLGTEPEWVFVKPDLEKMLDGNDAALLIGDPGMTFPRQGLTVFDLATLWREHTDLGFVFAIWGINPNAIADSYSIDFAGACQEGLAQIEEIIDAYQPLLNLPRVALQNYLQRKISFWLDDELRAGLDLYYKLAFKHSLVTARRPLNL
jgi:chorismate dehydratase